MALRVNKKIFLGWQNVLHHGTVIPYLTGLNIYSQQAKGLGCIPKIIPYLHLDKIQHTDMY